MGATVELIVVGLVVTVALAWAVFAGWRAVKSKGVCSSCGSSDECPIANDPEALVELSQQGRLNQLDSCQPGGPSCQELAATLEKDSPAEISEPGST